MSLEQWVAVALLAVTLIGIIVRVERRMGNTLTREEHERICQERNARVEKQLAELRHGIAKRHEENKEFLRDISSQIRENEARRSKTEHDIRDSVYTLLAKIAVSEDRWKGRS